MGISRESRTCGRGTGILWVRVRVSPKLHAGHPCPSLTFIKGLSEREALIIHAEIKALKDRFGLSYKDSTHRLYMAEVA